MSLQWWIGVDCKGLASNCDYIYIFIVVGVEVVAVIGVDSVMLYIFKRRILYIGFDLTQCICICIEK